MQAHSATDQRRHSGFGVRQVEHGLQASGLKPSFGFNVHDLQQDPHAAIGRVLPHLMTGTANAAKI